MSQATGVDQMVQNAGGKTGATIQGRDLSPSIFVGLESGAQCASDSFPTFGAFSLASTIYREPGPPGQRDLKAE